MKNVVGKGLIVVVGLGFVACGDGGSSSGGSILAFPSNATEAQATIENGEKVEEVVAKNQQSSYTLNSIESSSTQNIAFPLHKVYDIIKQETRLNDYALNETIDETQACSNGGTIHSSGSGSETTGGTITTTFTNCNTYGVTINGSMLSRIYNYNSKYDEFENIDTSFLTDTSVKSNEVSTIIYANSTSNTKTTAFSDNQSLKNMQMKISAISESNGKKSGQNNAMYYFNNLNSSSPSMYQTQGKVYINNLASFVTYDTNYNMSQTPFVFNSSSLTSGEARYNMANGGKVKIVVESNKAKTYVDADGDGNYELSE